MQPLDAGDENLFVLVDQLVEAPDLLVRECSSKSGGEDVEAAVELRGDLGEAYSFAHRMLWEIYERETAAIDRALLGDVHPHARADDTSPHSPLEQAFEPPVAGPTRQGE